ncbi:chloride channel clic-like protein 1-like protein [Lasius niger]|uniref:Chloride channel CLIC-like protein 1 n=1 Tax=Lasius niger TaxID=67767 RepID=A0A0J7KWU6_LASNI|nr:chloride channel clic-like protein 1-like protein [Lasius niger]
MKLLTTKIVKDVKDEVQKVESCFEAEIKLMATQAQFAEMPIACQPHKMGLWDKMVASFSPSNDCEKYYESIMTNPRLQVTPAYALTYFLSTVIFQPLTYFGLVISEFIDNATSNLNFMYKIPIIIMLFLTFCVCIILLPFSLIGGSIKFGIGPFFKFGIKGKANSNERQDRIERIYEDTSPKKRLKDSEMMKQITFRQQDKDPAGGDAGIDIHHLSEKHIKCKCKNENAGPESRKYDAGSISPRSPGSPSPLTTTKRTTPRSGSPGATDILDGGCFERLNVG